MITMTTYLLKIYHQKPMIQLYCQIYLTIMNRYEGYTVKNHSQTYRYQIQHKPKWVLKAS